jgi:large subunit ribosomal protein L7A
LGIQHNTNSGGFKVQELLKRKGKVIGIKQTGKAAEQDRLESVFIAQDADPSVTGQLRKLCEEKNIKIYSIDTRKQLGKAAGIDVGASVVGILKTKD